MTKKMIESWIYPDVTVIGGDNLGEIAQSVAALIEKYGAATEIRFDSGYSSIDEQIRVDREETDSEYQKRLKRKSQEKDRIISKEDKERKEYRRLKKKYG